jgi:predicted porin
MNQSLLKQAACAVVAMAAGAASAQSNVTVYGIVNINALYTKSDTAPARWGIDPGGWWASRLGFRGTEDLGGGVSAVFQLENGFNPDTGMMGQGGRLFGRHAWVGLRGDFGTVRLGRAWTPTYTLLCDTIDPFEDALSGAAGGFLGRNIFNAIDIRMQNALFYAKTIGGFKADLAYALGETAGNASANRQISTAFTYSAGPLKAVLGYHDVKDANGTGSSRLLLAGGTYDLGVAKVHFGIDQQKTNATGLAAVDANDILLGLTVPVGAAGRVLASVNRLDDHTALNADMKKYAIGYTHNLSKRTTLFTSYGYTNRDRANRMDFGIRHMF